MSLSTSIKTFEREILKELNNNNLNIFAGAGLSRGSGFVDWKELLREIAFELDLDINKENDLVSLAQYHFNVNGRHTINEAIVSQFQRAAEENETMNILARLPICTFWTTNYDSIIEDALNKVDKVADVKIQPSQMKYFKPNRGAVVYKMHGDKNYPDQAVITRDDFEGYSRDREAFTTKLKGELISKMFLFIGFSFEDPNLEQILSKIRVDLISDSPKTHFCFLRRINEYDERYSLGNGEYDQDTYNYDKIKQELKIKDLKRYGIHTVLVNKHSEITDILRNVEEKLKLNKIFISGSAHDYGNYTENEAKELLHSISADLVNNNNHVTSGFGLGVGSYVINGALEAGHKHNLKINNYLTLRPFPQNASGKKTIDELWNEYRKDILDNNGIAIFVFGNKLNGSEVVLADGILKEFNLALERNLYIIPIGSTGYVAEDILNRIIDDTKTYWYLEESLDILKTSKDNSILINEIKNIINRIKSSK